jgi:hypothetical protein
MRVALLMVLALMCAGCGGDGEKTSSPSPPSSSSSSSESSTDNSPNEDKAPVEEPEKLPELDGEEVQVGKIYQNGEALKMSVYGVSFKLPEETACAIGQDATAMELAAVGKQCLGVIFLKRDVDKEEALELLRQPQDVQGIILQPRGEPAERDGVHYATHGDATYEGHSALIIGPEKNGVLFFLGGLKRDSQEFKGIIEALAAGTKIGAPLESRSERQWKELLSGHTLTYMSSSYSPDALGGHTGHSSEINIKLFADGSFTYRNKSDFTVGTGGGAGAYGDDRGTDEGSWKIEMIGAAHVLTLTSSRDGGKREYTLAYRDNKTYLNGTRYFRVPIQ